MPPPSLFSFPLFFPRALLHIGGEKEEVFCWGDRCILHRRAEEDRPLSLLFFCIPPLDERGRESGGEAFNLALGAG